MAGGGGNNRQKKSAFSLFGLFKSKGFSYDKKSSSNEEYEYMKAYKVYPSDEDRGRWVAEPGIDRMASAYISLTTDKWEKLG